MESGGGIIHPGLCAVQAKCGCGFGGGRPEPPAALSARYGVDNTAAAAARREALSPGGERTCRDWPPAYQKTVQRRGSLHLAPLFFSHGLHHQHAARDVIMR